MNTIRVNNTIDLVSSFIEHDNSYLEKKLIEHKERLMSRIYPAFKKTFLGHFFEVFNSPLN